MTRFFASKYLVSVREVGPKHKAFDFVGEYFPTFEEAKAYLVALAEQKLERARKELKSAERRLERAKKLAPKSPPASGI